MRGQPSTIGSPLGSSPHHNQGTPTQIGRNSSNQQVNAVSSWGQRGSQQEEKEYQSSTSSKRIDKGLSSTSFELDERVADVPLSKDCENKRVAFFSENSLASQESDKVKNLRHHLLILLHAHKCQQKRESGKLEECNVQACATMRAVLEHMKICRVGGQWQCPVPHCTSSCKILAHWKSCKKQSCHICAPMKQPNLPGDAGALARNNQRPPSNPAMQHSLRAKVMRQPQFSKSPGNFSVKPVQTKPWDKSQGQDWRDSISPELRSHLMDKMLLSLKSSAGQAVSSTDQEISSNWLAVAKEVEAKILMGAASSEEYFRLMTEKSLIMAKGAWQSGSSHNNAQSRISTVVHQGHKGIKAPKIATEKQLQPEKMVAAKKESVNSSGGPTVQSSWLEAKSGKVAFSASDLRTSLLPPLEKLYAQEPESEPFRTPVDPVALGIEGYFEVVKKPMDLSKIRRKLEVGSYQDPWQFISDVYLMLENAWLYNKKNSRVYKYTSRVRYMIHAIT